jgi:tetratricopeptide (TPR) repeat protein
MVTRSWRSLWPWLALVALAGCTTATTAGRSAAVPPPAPASSSRPERAEAQRLSRSSHRREEAVAADERRTRYSARPDVDLAVVEGERAFERGDLEGALEGYARALALEPENYFATLWTGDVHFKAQHWERAAQWFRRAVALEPNVETAHRYLGDVLRRQGRDEEALEEYIEAVIASPQSEYPKHTLQRWFQNLRKPVPELPRDRLELGGVRIGLGGPDGRQGLAEQVAALRKVAALQVDDGAWRERIAGLATLRDAGLLEPYVVLERFNPDVARDYAAYRAAHRKELRRYLRVYWCGQE